MEMETALELLKYGWPTVLSAAGLVLVWALVRPGGNRNRPLLTLAVERVYSDVVRGVGIWWRYRRETLEARRDRDREIAQAYSTARPGGTRSTDRLLPGIGTDESGNSDLGVDPGVES